MSTVKGSHVDAVGLDSKYVLIQMDLLHTFDLGQNADGTCIAKG
jgi:hypothetical protein